METKQDRRVLRTRAAIRAAFLHQLETVGYDAITVRSLTEEAQINRNTFYLHYEDKPALTRAITDQCLHQLETDLAATGTPVPGDEQRWIHILLDAIFRHIQADFPCYHALLRQGPAEFSQRLQCAIRAPFLAAFPDHRLGHIAAGITADGILGSLNYWMDHPDEIERQAILKVLPAFCLTGLREWSDSLELE